MGDQRQRPNASIWRATCTACTFLSEIASTILVLILAITVCCLAYVATQKIVPVPDFILRQLEDQFESKGIAIKMESVRYYFDGTILLESPKVFSTTLNSQVASAELIKINLNIPLLLFGKVKIGGVAMSNGTFELPPVISPSGVSVKLIENLDFEVYQSPHGFDIKYAKLRYANASLYASGELSPAFITPKGEKEPINITATILKIGPQLWNQRKIVEDLNKPSINLKFHVSDSDKPSLDAQISIGKSKYKDFEIQSLLLNTHAEYGDNVATQLEVTSLTGPQEVSIGRIGLAAQWDQFPNKNDWHPDRIAARLTHIEKGNGSLPSTFAIARKTGQDTALIEAAIDIANRTWTFDTAINTKTLSGTTELTALIDPETASLASKLSGKNLRPFAQLGTPADLVATINFPSFKKYDSVRARFSTGQLASLGAKFDRTTGSVRIDGPQIYVDDIHVQTGPQDATIDIAFNQKTLKRRFLIEGSMDPNAINRWFKPWWAGIWANFQFPETGVYTLLDSRSTFLQPDSVRVTGFAAAKDIGIREQTMESIWLKYFIRFYYLDFYDADLQRSEGYARGETQIAIARDPRDEKEKMTALWVDAESTMDIKIGDRLIYEVGPGIRNILSPYTYITPPKLTAQATSIQTHGHFDYNIDLKIDTQEAITLFDFPFESLQADVFIDNAIIDIKDAQGGLAGGILDTTAQIVDGEIDIEAKLIDASFAGTLKSTVTYFEATADPEDETSDEDPVNIEELTEYGGKLDANFKGQGKVGDSFSYTGNGRFDISEANLANIQLLGGLSKALQSAQLGFSSLKFTKASGDFKVNKKFLQLPSPVISGPTAVINTSGRYNMEKDKLDFQAKLFPFKKTLLSKALFPIDLISHIFEIHISGNLRKPAFNVFSTSENIEEEQNAQQSGAKSE